MPRRPAATRVRRPPWPRLVRINKSGYARHRAADSRIAETPSFCTFRVTGMPMVAALIPTLVALRIRSPRPAPGACQLCGRVACRHRRPARNQPSRKTLPQPSGSACLPPGPDPSAEDPLPDSNPAITLDQPAKTPPISKNPSTPPTFPHPKELLDFSMIRSHDAASHAQGVAALPRLRSRHFERPNRRNDG